MKVFSHKPSKLDPLTKFSGGPDSINRRVVSDFWQWAYSDLMQNTERGVLAEYIVAVLLGVDDKLRVPWLAYDLKLPDGKTVEVKTMSRLQAWFQKVCLRRELCFNLQEDGILRRELWTRHRRSTLICILSATSMQTTTTLQIR